MLRQHLVQGLRSVLHGMGLDVVRYDASQALPERRKRLLGEHGIDLILDVGANIGQFAQRMRELGYRGRIVSFEPLSSAYEVLSRTAQGDPAWECRHMAIGDRNGEATIHIAGNSWSSSLLPMESRHVASAPDSAYTGAEQVPLCRLDAVEDLIRGPEHVYLKLDTQGFELPALMGAEGLLSRVRVIETELSLVPLYEGQALLGTVVSHLDSLGFELLTLEKAFTDPRTGNVLQMDGLFARREGDR